MAFRTGVSLGDGFQDAKNQAAWVKGIMQSALVNLAGTVDANFIFQLVDNIRAAISLLNRDASVSGMGAYAQAQYNDNTYNVATEFTNMVNALNGVISWVVTNFPKDTGQFLQAYKINADGSRAPATFTSAQTAGLTSALNAAVATIS